MHYSLSSRPSIFRPIYIYNNQHVLGSVYIDRSMKDLFDVVPWINSSEKSPGPSVAPATLKR